MMAGWLLSSLLSREHINISMLEQTFDMCRALGSQRSLCPNIEYVVSVGVGQVSNGSRDYFQLPNPTSFQLPSTLPRLMTYT